MNKERSLQVVILSIFAVALIVMSVGFATLTSQLNISGNVKVKTTSYDVKFNESSYQLSSGSESIIPAPTIDGTAINYDVTLTKPGDYVEFTINVQNAGTLNAKLTGITLGGLDADQKKFVSYVVTYDGTEYNETTTELSRPINASETKALKVRAEYILPSQADELPSADVTVNLTCVLSYSTV